jgi:hypothetical protein
MHVASARRSLKRVRPALVVSLFGSWERIEERRAILSTKIGSSCARPLIQQGAYRLLGWQIFWQRATRALNHATRLGANLVGRLNDAIGRADWLVADGLFGLRPDEHVGDEFGAAHPIRMDLLGS